jgi:Pretoxin HINT domain
MIAISKLKAGEKVMATRVDTGRTSAVRVAAVLVHFDTNRYDLTVKVGRRAAVIATTSNHAFWDQTTHRWTMAADLRNGELLRSPDGARVTAFGGHASRSRSGWMWDLTIPGDHDFYVTAAGAAVLVHNAPGPGCSIISSADAPPLCNWSGPPFGWAMTARSRVLVLDLWPASGLAGL